MPTMADFFEEQEQQERKERVPLKKSLKTEILFIQKGGCALCGLDFYKEGIYPDYHHVDGNPSNNDKKNIQALCPNCHRRLTHKQNLESGEKAEKKKGKDRRKPQLNGFEMPVFEQPKIKLRF